MPSLETLRRSVVVLALAVPSAALAQPGRFELTPMASYRLVGDLDLDDTAFLEESLEIDEGSAFGVAFDIPLGRSLQLELLANRQESELIADGGFFTDELVLADVEVTYLHVGLLWQFLSGQVHPYVVGSLGVARLTADLPGGDDPKEDRPSLSFGGGVKIFWSEHLGLRLEGRGYWVALDEDDDRDHRDRWRDEDSLTQTEASVGLIFAW